MTQNNKMEILEILKIQKINRLQPLMIFEYFEKIPSLYIVFFEKEYFLFYLSKKETKNIYYRIKYLEKNEFDKLRLKDLSIRDIFIEKISYEIKLDYKDNVVFVEINNEIIKIKKNKISENDYPKIGNYIQVI
jgi:hypothetical protein